MRFPAFERGFRITPQINALGRLEDARCGVKFLLGSDPEETEQVGATLALLNTKRKDIERSIFDEVQRLIKNGVIDIDQEQVIMAGSKQWQAGVIGLVASRLVAEYARPVILFHITDSGMAKGSCRSIKNFDMFKALEQCADLLTSFGGHPMAAGLALPVAHVAQLKERLELLTRQLLTPEDFQRYLTLDATIAMNDIGTKLVKDLELFEPFGAENATLSFCLRKVTLIAPPQLMKDLHVKIKVFSDGIIKPVVFFNRPELFQFFMDMHDQSFDLAVQVTQNHWQGKVNVELLGLDCTNGVQEGML